MHYVGKVKCLISNLVFTFVILKLKLNPIYLIMTTVLE